MDIHIPHADHCSYSLGHAQRPKTLPGGGRNEYMSKLGSLKGLLKNINQLLSR